MSNSSHAPSSYHRKRVKLSSISPFSTPVGSRPSSTVDRHLLLPWPNTAGSPGAPATPSRVASTHSPSRPQSHQTPSKASKYTHDRRQSMSQISIPISALVSPHAPSITTSSKFHMRDPRKPPRKCQDTEWGLRFASGDAYGSPLHAWLFFIGFILFPLWWIAAVGIPIPRTRTAGDSSMEKAVTVIDDPQIEHGESR